MIRKILIVFGTRPEAIKMIPVLFALRGTRFEVKMCVTAQHREMLDQVLNFFQVLPDYDLNLMQAGQNLSGLTGKVLTELTPILADFSPDAVLVHGDTTTSMAASLASFYARVPVGHIEAGLRSFNRYSPYPEEMNRTLTSRMATWHFAPTKQAKQNLLNEQVNEQQIAVTGNTVIDALFLGLEKIEKVDSQQSAHLTELQSKINPAQRMILVTAHRRENFGSGFIQIAHALLDLAAMDGVQIIFPVHPNPNVSEVMTRMLGNNKNILLLEPQSYESFLYLMSKSFIVLTDSGGIQEEAPSLKKPVLLMRDTTERPEGLDAGLVKLVSTSQETIVGEAKRLLDEPSYYQQMTASSNPYGDGNAAKRIADYLLQLT